MTLLLVIAIALQLAYMCGDFSSYLPEETFFRTFVHESDKLRAKGRAIACSGRKSIIGSFKIWVPFAHYVTFNICFFFFLQVLDYTGTSTSRVGGKIIYRK